MKRIGVEIAPQQLPHIYISEVFQGEFGILNKNERKYVKVRSKGS